MDDERLVRHLLGLSCLAALLLISIGCHSSRDRSPWKDSALDSLLESTSSNPVIQEEGTVSLREKFLRIKQDTALWKFVRDELEKEMADKKREEK